MPMSTAVKDRQRAAQVIPPPLTLRITVLPAWLSRHSCSHQVLLLFRFGLVWVFVAASNNVRSVSVLLLLNNITLKLGVLDKPCQVRTWILC